MRFMEFGANMFQSAIYTKLMTFSDYPINEIKYFVKMDFHLTSIS